MAAPLSGKKPAFIDLTKPLDSAVEIYPGDPEFEAAPWCDIPRHGYRVSALRLGTQTGTHIDAPAHFDSAGATLEQLPIDRLVGEYLLVDLPDHCSALSSTALSAYRLGNLLFLRCTDERARLSDRAFTALLELKAAVWVLAGEIELDGEPPLEFHRRLARGGVYLVENLDRQAAARVPPQGELMALPLRLAGTSGAPCRVVVRFRE